MDQTRISRRRLLASSFALGCSAAASPLVTPVTFAVTPGDARLVVIVLRGGMDGLDAIQPVGDRALAGLRDTISQGEAGGAHDLDGFFMAHAALGPLMPLWAAGELAVAHAVSTPYRDKRSHFDGQDLLENGSADPGGVLTPGRDGWLNRMLALMPGARAETAFAVGRENMLLLRGDQPVSSWSPDGQLSLSPQAELLLDLIYRDDPLFHEASRTAIALTDEETKAMGVRQAGRATALAAFAAKQLRGEARVAAFSINGWDTHLNQHQSLPRALGTLSDAILTLKTDLGPAWDQTAVLCLTEFGRTVRQNGGRGTDHGTGGAALFAGGALKGGQVLGAWPGLGERDLYKGRDLMPTADVRGYAAWAIRGLFGLGTGDLEAQVFPGLDMGLDPRLIA